MAARKGQRDLEDFKSNPAYCPKHSLKLTLNKIISFLAESGKNAKRFKRWVLESSGSESTEELGLTRIKRLSKEIPTRLVEIGVKGRCTLLIKPAEDVFQEHSIHVVFYAEYKERSIEVKISIQGVEVKVNQEVKTFDHPLKATQIYWLCINGIDDFLYFGHSEPRPNLCLFQVKLEELSGTPDFSKKISHFSIKKAYQGFSFMNSSVSEEPLVILDREKMTLSSLAEGKTSTISRFPSELQELYEMISGNDFRIDTPDFPEFSNAIQWSITNPDGWCYKKILEKARGNNIKRVYLRVTIGRNNGNAPGFPYVLEIWPAGHFSPVHRHSDSFVMIKVLKGIITVKLYSELDVDVNGPYSELSMVEGQISWISPDFNQTHQVINSRYQSATITLQAYKYALDDSVHYEFFDFIDHDEKVIRHLKPSSDCEFFEFKEIIKKEWEKYREI
jgi:hypothetical protein